MLDYLIDCMPSRMHVFNACSSHEFNSDVDPPSIVAIRETSSIDYQDLVVVNRQNNNCQWFTARINRFLLIVTTDTEYTNRMICILGNILSISII